MEIRADSLRRANGSLYRRTGAQVQRESPYLRLVDKSTRRSDVNAESGGGRLQSNPLNTALAIAI
jgi:hypothetical protein